MPKLITFSILNIQTHNFENVHKVHLILRGMAVEVEMRLLDLIRHVDKNLLPEQDEVSMWSECDDDLLRSLARNRGSRRGHDEGLDSGIVRIRRDERP